MNDADDTQDRGLTTEQIAAAGSEPVLEDIPASAGDDSYDDGYADSPGTGLAAPADADRGVPDASNGRNVAADTGSQHASLLDEDELQNITMRWKDIQAGFVDEPETAVQDADALVAELMQRLATMFAAERSELENRWAGGNQVSTEELRQGLRLYHSFFERLLAA
jgi:hypothetical protein